MRKLVLILTIRFCSLILFIAYLCDYLYDLSFELSGPERVLSVLFVFLTYIVIILNPGTEEAYKEALERNLLKVKRKNLEQECNNLKQRCKDLAVSNKYYIERYEDLLEESKNETIS